MLRVSRKIAVAEPIRRRAASTLINVADSPSKTPFEFLAHDASLRVIARSLLFDEHGVEDVLQQTWLAALRRGPDSPLKLRAWLASVVRNLALDARRRRVAREGFERRGARAEALPSTSELLAFEEARRTLMNAIISLPEPYRSTVWLRYFDHLQPREIAERMGCPVETVRTRLKRGLENLRLLLNKQSGGAADGWRASLLPLAAAHGGSLTYGGSGKLIFTMATTKTKATILAASLALTSILAWFLISFFGDHPGASPSATLLQNAPVAAATAPDPARVSAPDRTRRTGVESLPSDGAGPASKSAADARFGSLTLTMIWGDDKKPAAGVFVSVESVSDKHPWSDPPSGVTSADGKIQFDKIPGGQVWLRCDRWMGPILTIVAGEAAEKTIEIPAGYQVSGIVTTAAGEPVEGADIILNEQGIRQIAVTKSGKNGEFTIRSVDPMIWYYVGAVKSGFAPTPQLEIMEPAGSVAKVKLIFPGAGGVVSGQVYDSDGKPAANVKILIGESDRVSITTPEGARAIRPAKGAAVSDAAGRFVILGLAIGARPVVAHAAGFAPWNGNITVPSEGSASLSIYLTKGTSVRGIVKTPGGAPIVDAQVSIGEYGDFLYYATRSGADGSFLLRDLPNSEVTIHAGSLAYGRTIIKIAGAPGAELIQDIIIDPGLSVRGRVVTDAGAPVAGLYITISTDSPEAGGYYNESTRTDAAGRFELKHLKDVAHRLQIGAARGSFDLFMLNDIRPSNDEILIHYNSTEPDATISGTVADESGKAIEGVKISIHKLNVDFSPIASLKERDGFFKTEKLPAGKYRLYFSAAGFAETRTSAIELKAGAAKDIGIITLRKAGKIKINYTSPAPLPHPPLFTLFDGEGDYATSGFERDGAAVATAEGLAEGDYYITILGFNIKTERIPVRVEAGRETEISVTLQPGISRIVEIHPPDAPAGALEMQNSSLKVIIKNPSGSDLIQQILRRPPGSKFFFIQIGFAAGDYSYEVTGAVGSAAGKFTIAREPSDEPILIKLQ